MAGEEPQVAAVLGSPIRHSLSPVLHTAGYAALGLTGWSYRAIELTQDQFPTWFAALGPRWRGLSLTMPLKRVVIPLLDEVNPLAGTVGAVNTVTWAPDGHTVGDNTDVHGIVAALRGAGVEKARSACLLGAGATACSAVAALAELGCDELVVLARSPERAGPVVAVADELGFRTRVAGLDQVSAVLSSEVVISTLPAAAGAAWAEAARLLRTTNDPDDGRRRPGPPVPPAGVLLDVTYHPWPTPAARSWTEGGGIAVGGFEMLLHQAGAQFTLMTGRPAPLDAMRAAGERALR